jgi:hypothetical protein
MNNPSTDTHSTDTHSTGREKARGEYVREYLVEFFRESVEAMAIMAAVYVIMDRGFDRRILKIGVLLGLISTAMHALDEESHARIKDSMKNAVGNSFVASAVGRVGR